VTRDSRVRPPTIDVLRKNPPLLKEGTGTRTLAAKDSGWRKRIAGRGSLFLTLIAPAAKIRGSFQPPTPSAAQEARAGQELESVANIKSAEKRAGQAVKRRAHNMAARSRLRTSIKKVLTAIGAGNKDEATAAFKAAQPVIDTMVTKGIIHSNKAARHKRELNAKIKAIGASASK